MNGLQNSDAHHIKIGLDIQKNYGYETRCLAAVQREISKSHGTLHPDRACIIHPVKGQHRVSQTEFGLGERRWRSAQSADAERLLEVRAESANFRAQIVGLIEK